MRPEQIADQEFEDIGATITKQGDSYELKRDDGWISGFSVGGKNATPPKADGHVQARYYGRRHGSIRGLMLDGVTIYYETDEEMNTRQEVERIESDLEKQAEFISRNAEWVSRINALPEPLRDRFARLQSHNPSFGWRFGWDELMACEDAAKIADAVKPGDIEAFGELTWDQQKLIVPGLNDGHSGNSFGFACFMARVLHESPETAPCQHGAMAMLTGLLKSLATATTAPSAAESEQGGRKMPARRTIHAANPYYPQSESMLLTTGEGDKPGTVLLCLPGIKLEVWPHDAELFAAAIQDEARRCRERDLKETKGDG